MQTTAAAEHVGQLLAAARRGRQVRAQVSGRVVRVGQHSVVAVMLLQKHRKTNKKEPLFFLLLRYDRKSHNERGRTSGPEETDAPAFHDPIANRDKKNIKKKFN